MSIYGYCRISRKTQSIERQERNIKSEYPEAVIVREAFTGTRINRPQWQKLHNNIKSGDTIIFDSVSRMSRNADEGIETYMALVSSGIRLIFLKEHYIDTDVYQSSMKDKIELQGTDEDCIFRGINDYFRLVAKKQIRIAFEQAEKEVQDLHQRTKEGIETARLAGKQIGGVAGRKLTTKKSLVMKEQILKLSRDYNGTLADIDVINRLGLARNTFYKYKRELNDKYRN